MKKGNKNFLPSPKKKNRPKVRKKYRMKRRRKEVTWVSLVYHELPTRPDPPALAKNSSLCEL